MRWPEVWGEGACLGLIGFLGKGICGAYRAHFLSPGRENVVPELCSVWFSLTPL